MGKTLENKTVYAFGDSIVNGHCYRKGFMDFIARDEKMNLKKYAINGATIGDGAINPSSYISDQIKNVDEMSPDFIVFNGLTNDCQSIFSKKEYEIGNICENFVDFDTKTFCGSFENICSLMKNKWKTAKIVYVAVHNMCSRDDETQKTIQALVKKICEKWDIHFVDLYNKNELNTWNEEHKNKYTFDDLTEDGLPGICGSGTHPNIDGYMKFYVPHVTKKLIELL